MITQNSAISHFKKRETALKWLFMSFGYFILFVFLEDPRYKTISIIGKSRIGLFVVFCLFYIVSMLSNFDYLKRNFEIKSKILYPLAIVSNLCFGFVVTTLMPDKSIGDVTTFSTIAHWIFGFGNIIINATASLVFCLSISKQRKSKKLKTAAIFGTCVCIADLLFFVVMTAIFGDPQKSKNGFFEIIPLFISYFTLYVVNHTDLGKPIAERDEKEKSITVRDSNIFSSICFVLLTSAFFFMTFYAFVRNPVHFTISMTGVDYPTGFMIVSILLALSLSCNFIMMFKRSNYKNYLVWAISVIGSFSILGCVFSPTKLGTDLDIIHSVSALIFFYSIMGSFLVFMISQRKKNKKQKPFMWGMFIILLLATSAIILLFVILDQRYGRTGLTELIPIEYIFFCFYMNNHTEYFKVDNKDSMKTVVLTSL